MPFVFDGAYNVTSNSAELWFEFTGGDASYGNYRPLRLTISGTNYNNRVLTATTRAAGIPGGRSRYPGWLRTPSTP